MGWQDAPVIGNQTSANSPAWMNAPVVGGQGAQATPAPATATSAPTSPQTPVPQAASWSDYLLQHLASAGAGVHNALRTFENAYTLGAGDLATAALAKLPGVGAPDVTLAQQHAQTAAAQAALPWYVRYPTEAAGYMAGPGALGIAGRLGGGVLGTAGEGAVSGGISGAMAADSPQDALTRAGIGAVGGGGLGAVGGALGKYIVNPITGALGFGPKPGASPQEVAAGAITDAARKQKTDSYAALDDVIHRPADIANGVDAVRDSIYGGDTGTWRNASPMTSKLLDGYYDRLDQAAMAKQPSTGSELNQTIKQLDKVAAKNQGSFEGYAATQARDGLTDLFHTVPPLTTPGGVDPAALLAKANADNMLFKNAEGLQQSSRDLKYWGTDPGAWAQGVAQKFYPDPTSPQFQALSKIAMAGGGGPVNTWNLSHVAHPFVEGAATAAFGPAVGMPLGEALTYLGVKPGAAALLKGGQQTAKVNALINAYPSLTNQTLSFAKPQALGPAARALLFGPAAASGF